MATGQDSTAAPSERVAERPKNRSIVAYLDILGYREFLKSNSPIETAERVFKIVQEAPQQALKDWGPVPGDKETDEWEPIVKRVRSLVFSDTIVIALSVDERPSLDEIALPCFMCGHIGGTMFKAGLPVRGAVTIGSFLFRDTCIAGMAVVEAYEMTQHLQMAGVVICDPLNRLIDELYSEGRDFWDDQLPYFFCPFRGREEVKMRVVRTMGKLTVLADFLGATRRAFWMWGKDIPAAVDPLVDNTAKLLNYLAFVRETSLERAKERAQEEGS